MILKRQKKICGYYHLGPPYVESIEKGLRKNATDGLENVIKPFIIFIKAVADTNNENRINLFNDAHEGYKSIGFLYGIKDCYAALAKVNLNLGKKEKFEENIRLRL